MTKYFRGAIKRCLKTMKNTKMIDNLIVKVGGKGEGRLYNCTQEYGKKNCNANLRPFQIFINGRCSMKNGRCIIKNK